MRVFVLCISDVVYEINELNLDSQIDESGIFVFLMIVEPIEPCGYTWSIYFSF